MVAKIETEIPQHLLDALELHGWTLGSLGLGEAHVRQPRTRLLDVVVGRLRQSFVLSEPISPRSHEESRALSVGAGDHAVSGRVSSRGRIFRGFQG